MRVKYLTTAPRQTKKLGEILAKEVLRTKVSQKGALIVGLEGDLGGGKTTFLQGLAKGLGIKEKILSPTFIIIKAFKIPSSNFKFPTRPNGSRPTEQLQSFGRAAGRISNFQKLIHVDAYRLKDEKELEKLGWKDLISNPKNLIFIEWPENVIKALPKKHHKVSISHIKEGHRKFKIKSI